MKFKIVDTVGAASVILLLGGCGIHSSPPQSNASRSLRLTQVATPQFVYTLPAGDTAPASLAGDPQGRGVWFVTGSDSATFVVYVSSTPNEDRTYPVGTYLPFGGNTAITVAPDGTVWAGVDMTLIHLVPSTGAVTRFDVPSPSDSPLPESYRPPSVRGTHDIVSLAVSDSGQVALAISAAAQVTVLDQGVFSAWPLPADTDPVDVAYLSDGTLGVNLNDYDTHYVDELATFTTDGVRTDSGIVSTQVPRLIASGTTLITIGREMAVFDKRAAIITAAVPVPESDNTAQPITVRPLAVLPSGNVLVPSRDGIVFVSVSGGQTMDVPFRPIPCYQPSVALPPGVSPPPSSVLCSNAPLFASADAAGDIWFVVPSEPNMIGLLQGITF